MTETTIDAETARGAMAYQRARLAREAAERKERDDERRNKATQDR